MCVHTGGEVKFHLMSLFKVWPQDNLCFFFCFTWMCLLPYFHTNNTTLHISCEIASNSRHHGCASVCFNSVWALTKLNTHQGLCISVSFSFVLCTFMKYSITHNIMKLGSLCLPWAKAKTLNSSLKKKKNSDKRKKQVTSSQLRRSELIFTIREILVVCWNSLH